MFINFMCKGCDVAFDCDVGNIRIDDQTFRPVFSNSIVCPTCGERDIDGVRLTELGQSQMTEATM